MSDSLLSFKINYQMRQHLKKYPIYRSLTYLLTYSLTHRVEIILKVRTTSISDESELSKKPPQPIQQAYLLWPLQPFKLLWPLGPLQPFWPLQASVYLFGKRQVISGKVEAGDSSHTSSPPHLTLYHSTKAIIDYIRIEQKKII